MKNRWETLPLEALAIQQKGAIKIGPFGSQLKKCDLVSSGIHVIGIENVLSETFDGFGGRFISPEKFQTLRTVEILPGDLLITMMGTIGKVAIVPDGIGTSIMDSHLLRIRPDRKLCRTDYLAWAIYGSPAVQQAMDAQAHGAIMRGLNSAIVRSLPILLPPLPEQQRLVGILDEAFEGIATAKANAERNRRNARALFESHLQSVFTQHGRGWKQKTLEEIATTFGRGKSKHRPRNAPHLYGGKYPFVQTGDIRNADHIITDYSQTYSEAGLAQSKLWPRGTICITIAANIAETAILGFDACFPDSVIGVVANPKEAEVGFIEYLLQSFKARLQAMGKGSAQANINMGTFENEQFPFPSVAEQKQIVAKLDDLREETQRLESIYQQKLNALDALKKSLLHQTFTAQLTQQSVESALDPFPTRIANITPTDLHAGILAMAYQLHEKHGKQTSFGHVKAEKIAHMVEAFAGIDLERSPLKDAAGPNDYPHLMRVEHRAKKAGFFSFARVEGSAYRVTKYRNFDALVERTRRALGARKAHVDSLLELMLPMSTQQAEIFSTVYAAWNNLLLDRQAITDNKIVLEARDNWHPDKMSIQRERFFKAIKWMRKNNFVPLGKGRKVSSRAK